MKKIGFMSLIIIATLFITLSFPAAAAGPKAPAVPAAPAVAAAPAAALESAEHDFEGHRSEAIKHLDMAIHEAEVCERMP
jgi:hypothetical protein